MKTRNSQKGPKTREHIFETAIALFQKNGYDQTTMREIAAGSDVALGNTYYYFRSKEHLVFALYERTLELQVVEADAALAKESKFQARFAAVLRSNIQILQPYHAVLRALFRLAGDPDSPLNPFAPETQSIRNSAQSIFARVAEAGTQRLSPAMREDLPELLWLSYMGIVLYWLYDRSPNCAKTQKLIDKISELAGLVLSMAALPMMNKLLEMLVRMVKDFRQ